MCAAPGVRGVGPVLCTYSTLPRRAPGGAPAQRPPTHAGDSGGRARCGGAVSVMRERWVGGRARRGARQKQARGVAGAPVVTRLCRGPLSTIATEAVASGGASRGTGHVVMRGVGRLGRRDAPNPPLPPLSPLNKPLHPWRRLPPHLQPPRQAPPACQRTLGLRRDGGWCRGLAGGGDAWPPTMGAASQAPPRWLVDQEGRRARATRRWPRGFPPHPFPPATRGVAVFLFSRFPVLSTDGRPPGRDASTLEP